MPATPPLGLSPALATATALARSAGALLREGWGTNPATRTKSSDIDIVTEYDGRAEALIVAGLEAAFPDDSIVGEEGARRGSGASGRVWYVDPLDGTTNFAHGLPLFSVSLGLAIDRVPVLGVVHAPALGWMFTGADGLGAFRDDAPITVSRAADLGRALFATGFPYVRERARSNIPEVEAFLACSHGVRRLGSAALDLAAVACGWMDGFWERHIQAWDLVGGAAIVRAAGGRVTDIDGGAFDGETGRVLATNGLVHDGALAVLKRVNDETGGPWP